jgi:integrase
MARSGLNGAKVKALAEAGARGLWNDGNGLYLRTDAKRASWIYRYKVAGRERQMGLGEVSLSAGTPGLSLAEARVEAEKWRKVLRDGRDPIAERDAQRAALAAVPEPDERAAERAAAATFKAVAEAMMDSREPEWRNPKHRAQWRSTLDTYAYPILGALPVAEVTTDDVLRVLRPIWNTKPETASRIRGRVERVLAYGKTIGLRSGENPAAWRGHLSEALPSPAKVKRLAGSGNHPALPWPQAGAFMADLRKRDGVAPRALEFAILTAARTGEVLGAMWSEIDMGAKVWTVPAERMKAGREHRVPLSGAAVAVLAQMQQHRPKSGDGPIFPGARRGQGLSGMAMLMMLRRMNEPGEGEAKDAPPRWRDGRTGEPITAHGFRSTFRDWCGEAVAVPREVAEAALAHTVRDKVEAAYARADLLERRRPVMEEWARFLSRAVGSGEVVELVQARAAPFHG